MPILGYSTEGNFNTANMTQSNIAYWVELQKEITHLQDEIPDSCKREFNKMWRKYISNNIKMAKTRADNDEVEQLIRSSVTKWQQEGYTVYTMNNYIYSSEYQSLSESKKEEIKHSLTMHANPNYGDIYSKSFMLVKEESEGSQQNQLLSTTWGQQNGFNQYTPNQYPAGCVAVAVGQIMKYHQYPTSFNWNGMPNTYATETTARFLKDVGESVDTKYNADGSSAKIEDALSALKNVYGYTNARKVDHNSDDVLKQLDLKRPVYMRGYDPVGILGLKRNGHAWVCDGYSASSKTTTWILKTLEDTPTGITPRKFTSAYTDTEVSSFIYFHMNWGWSGSYNGMYYYNDVNIPELDLNFSHGRENIIDIYPTNN